MYGCTNIQLYCINPLRFLSDYYSIDLIPNRGRVNAELMFYREMHKYYMYFMRYNLIPVQYY